jgi:hypothetical protein
LVPLANPLTVPNCQENLQDGVCSLACFLLQKKQRQTVLIASTAAIIGNTIAKASPVLFLVLPVNKGHKLQQKKHATNLYYKGANKLNNICHLKAAYPHEISSLGCTFNASD